MPLRKTGTPVSSTRQVTGTPALQRTAPQELRAALRPGNAVAPRASGAFPADSRPLLTAKQKGRQIALPPSLGSGLMTYFRFVIAVRSAESLTMPVAPHHPDS